MLLIRIHEFDDDNCEVWLELWSFGAFGEKWMWWWKLGDFMIWTHVLIHFNVILMYVNCSLSLCNDFLGQLGSKLGF